MSSKIIGLAVEHDIALPITALGGTPVSGRFTVNYEARGTQNEPPAKSYDKELGLLLAFLLWLFYDETEDLRYLMREFIFWLLRAGR